MTHFTGVIILRKRNTTVLVPLWYGSVERSNRAKAFPKIHENILIGSFKRSVTCICTCVGFNLAIITIISEYMLKLDRLHAALFSNGAGNPSFEAEVDDECVL